MQTSIDCVECKPVGSGGISPGTSRNRRFGNTVFKVTVCTGSLLEADVHTLRTPSLIRNLICAGEEESLLQVVFFRRFQIVGSLE